MNVEYVIWFSIPLVLKIGLALIVDLRINNEGEIMNELEKPEEKKEEKKFDSGDVFPNHLGLSSRLGYTADAGSFTLSMKELQKVALDSIRKMRKIEGEK